MLKPCGRRARPDAALVLALGTGAVLSPLHASNGLNLVGFGAESLGLGSADIPVSRDANAVNINPAGLVQIPRARFDGALVPFWSYDVAHSDALNDDEDIDNPFGVIGSGAYAQQALHPKLWLGAGLFVSGGSGINYDKLRTRYGTEDAYSAVFGVTKLATAAAWKFDEQWSVGLGLNLSYSSLRQKLFPRTSSSGADAADPADDFYGLRIDGADGLSWNGRLGVLYRPTPALSLGLSYANETDVRLRNGTATFNFGAIGLGDVKYEDVRIDGFALAQEFGGGVAWQVNRRWMLAAEVTLLDWSHALRDATLTATRPEDPAAPARIRFAQSLNHEDQVVVGLGVEYTSTEATRLRAGLNLSETPIPNRTLTPALNVTADWEFEFGFAHKLQGGWEIASTLQVQPAKTERYNNPEQPLGPSSEDYGLAALTVQLSRSW
jgi:long-chain fatty acid transport protein